MKKQYETPKMNSIDFECKTNLLAASCGGENFDVPEMNYGTLSLDISKIDNNKA